MGSLPGGGKMMQITRRTEGRRNIIQVREVNLWDREGGRERQFLRVFYLSCVKSSCFKALITTFLCLFYLHVALCRLLPMKPE